MILNFELSMPSNNAWNGKWGSEGEFYAKIINFGKTQKAETKAQAILDEGYFRYSFGDGWVAGVSVKKVAAKEAGKIRRKSKGFCGYDWMVDSIRQDQRIIPPSERRARCTNTEGTTSLSA